ncbi:hypothetical protein WICMUC_003479 [Wickerhamomyces mucosus]|uniref:Pyruvate decarboxylase n=1 Tax=Wickerhamomyces mucosus TaxID=1378264 RepID=A0A9P8PLH7_9ASCO|nr:hypothetical protein WICMUC_003479 [Wickerhamomyces mucosus]
MTPINIDQITTSSIKDSIPVGEYIFKRLEQIHNLGSIFGVPGDFNLSLLEYIYRTKLNWIGGSNELNSGYSADGYSRFTKSLGVLITTFGVGELSAINAISGAFTEYSKILHIVGIPSTKDLNQSLLYNNNDFCNRTNLHHLVPNIDPLKSSDFLIYTKMVDNICCIKKILMEKDDIIYILDEIIEEIFKTSRPGYLFLPVDLSDQLLTCTNNNLFNSSIENIHTNYLKILDNEEEIKINQLTNIILEKIYQSKNPSILIDILVDRFNNCQEMLQNFVNISQFNTYTTFMGKSIINEDSCNFIGDYQGELSNIGIKENFENSDLILIFGPYLNQINTGFFTMDLKTNSIIILFHPNYFKIINGIIETEEKNFNSFKILTKLIKLLDLNKLPINPPLKFENKLRYPNIKSSQKIISQSILLNKLQKSFLKPNDVIVCDTGSIMFGIPDLKFPKGVKYIGQHFYLSIGMALPASVGIGIAMKDLNIKNQRLILFEGDGSAQMTIQEISSFCHYKLNPIIFLLNNNGYSVERIIKGENRSYNDIKQWNWCKVFEFFNKDNSLNIIVDQIKTLEDLNKVFKSLNQNNDNSNIQFYEIELDEIDVPWRYHHINNYRLFPKSN